MHDVKSFVADPEWFIAHMDARRCGNFDHVRLASLVLEGDHLNKSLQGLYEDRKTYEAKMADRSTNPAIRATLPDLLREIKVRIQRFEEGIDETRGKITEILASLPNIPHYNVEPGTSEESNVMITRWGDIGSKIYGSNNLPKDHVALGTALGMMDFETAATMSGSRFVVLKGQLARLERALTQYMLDRAVNNGYTEVSPPLMVRKDAMYGTGQLPKFEDDLFKTSGDNPYYMIPTAEVPLTNLFAGVIQPTDKPIRYAAATQCFRAEAGSAGRDTRGMIRQHQFTKVELVTACAPENTDHELWRMIGHVESLLMSLGIPYRVMKLCVGDLGFSASRTYDIEVWLPSQGRYREISSISECGSFQARRMNARYRDPATGKPQFLTTLNGSAVAVGRALVAVMENYQTADGSIEVPDRLKSYMGGIEKIVAQD